MECLPGSIEDQIQMKYDKLIPNPWVVLREEFDDWAILFDPETGDGFVVDPVGVFIWKCLDGHHTFEDIIIALRQNFDQVPEEVQKDCIEFLDDLLKRGFAGSKLHQD
jgi:SynChlorMet cassette protein ScmD